MLWQDLWELNSSSKSGFGVFYNYSIYLVLVKLVQEV